MATATRPAELGVVDAALAIRRGELSPVELLESCLATIERTDPVVGAFVRLAGDAARAQARLAADGPATGVLHGIPFAVKDLLDTVNLPTECGSTVFAGRMPRWDATAVARIRAAGAVLVGKTATHEIAYGVSTPQVRNPWDPSKMASGSSGGSAAALAARQVPMALGTDTGGSLRLPSAFCGTTAIKPTYGLVPASGALALAPSFDVVGPMARSARDCWLLLRVLIHAAPPEPVSVAVDLRHVRIGVTDFAMPEQLAEVRLPAIEITQAAASMLVFAEASTEFREHVRRGRRSQKISSPFSRLGWPCRSRTSCTLGEYAAIRRDYADLLGQVDAILLTASPVTDLPHGVAEHEGFPPSCSL